MLGAHEPGQLLALSLRSMWFRISDGVVPQSAGASGARERAGGASRRLRLRAALRAALGGGQRFAPPATARIYSMNQVIR